MNDQFVQHMNWQDAIGQRMMMAGKVYDVVGVVENFHYDDFMEKIEPTVIPLTTEDQFNYLVVKINAGAVTQTAEFLHTTWQELIPDQPYNAFFQEEVFEVYFRDEDNIGKLFSFIALIALIISCMGLFGLISINITRRTKEISIRKVLGASMWHVVHLINKEFIVLLTFAAVIATPLGYLMVNAVLDSVHEYHITLSVTHFAFTFLMILITAALTVSSQIYKAAITNPVDALRNE